MKLLDKLFGKKKEAEFSEIQYRSGFNLLMSAQSLSVASFIPLADRFPKLEILYSTGKLTRFDFYSTIASVGLAFSRIVKYFPLQDADGYALAIRSVLDSWDKTAYSNMAEFCRYLLDLLKRGKLNDQKYFKEAIGAWILLKIHEDVDNEKIEELSNDTDILEGVGNNIYEVFSIYWD